MVSPLWMEGERLPIIKLDVASPRVYLDDDCSSAAILDRATIDHSSRLAFRMLSEKAAAARQVSDIITCETKLAA